MPVKKSFAVFTLAVLLFTVLVILWGAYVRATGSGAGCGSHWPLCNGEVIPDATDRATAIEFTHRVMSGVAFLLVLGMAIWAHRRFPRQASLRAAAYAGLFFMITEALIGAGLVLFGLVGENDSFARAWVMTLHLVNTFLLMAALTLTTWWAFGRPTPLRGISLRVKLSALFILLSLTILGCSGAVTALGDTLFPSDSLQEALRQDFATHAHLLIRLRVYHPVIASVVVLVVMLLAYDISRRARRRETGTLALATALLLLLEFGIGIVNFFLLAPIPLQIIHLLFAHLIWISAVLLGASAWSDPGCLEAEVVETIPLTSRPTVVSSSD